MWTSFLSFFVVFKELFCLVFFDLLNILAFITLMLSVSFEFLPLSMTVRLQADFCIKILNTNNYFWVTICLLWILTEAYWSCRLNVVYFKHFLLSLQNENRLTQFPWFYLPSNWETFSGWDLLFGWFTSQTFPWESRAAEEELPTEQSTTSPSMFDMLSGYSKVPIEVLPHTNKEPWVLIANACDPDEILDIVIPSNDFNFVKYGEKADFDAFPSCPVELSPHEYTLPSSVSSCEKYTPHEICAQGSQILTSFG